MQQILPMRRRFAFMEQASPHKRLRGQYQWVGLPIAMGIIMLAWQLLVMLSGYSSFTLPSPAVVAESFADAVNRGLLGKHIVVTLFQAVSGFTLALSISLVLGYIMAHTPWLERALAPVLAAFQAVPIIAIAPLIILWFGTGIQSKMLVAALITFFPMLLTTIVALRNVPQELREMALISGANRWQILRYVELPLSLPVLFAGVRTGLSLATTGAVVGEFVAGSVGLGAMINIARLSFNTPLVFVGLLTLAGMTLTLYLLMVFLERALVKWEA